MAIDAWNRIDVAFRTVPGSYDKDFGPAKANLAQALPAQETRMKIVV